MGTGKRILAAILLLIASPYAFADGKHLLSACTGVLGRIDGDIDKTPDVEAGFCMGVVTTIIQINATEKANGREPFFCTRRDDVQEEDAVRIIVRYLREHPQDLVSSDAQAATRALSHAFPCKQASASK